jgi:hypothetical protein
MSSASLRISTPLRSSAVSIGRLDSGRAHADGQHS